MERIAVGKHSIGVSARLALLGFAVLPLGAVAWLARSDAEPAIATTNAAPISKTTTNRASAIDPEIAPGATTPSATASAPRASVAPSATTQDPLVALRTASADEARAYYLQMLSDPTPLGNPELVRGLEDVAADPNATIAARSAAIDLIRRAPSIDDALLAKLESIAVSSALDQETRTRAVDALHQIALDRDELEPSLRPLLLDAADRAPSAEARALALDVVRTSTANETEIARVAAYLRDASAPVRTNAARALDSSPARLRTSVGQELERAIENESDEDAACALIETALRVGRADADALLARLARAPVVRANAALARQVDDYRGSLAMGETDPLRILGEHQTREDARLRSSGQ